MSALVIDTSSWVTFLASGEPRWVVDALREGRVYLTPVVGAEILSGRMAERERKELERAFAALPLCGTALQHWFRVGELRSRLGAKGLSVSTPDAHVARCALDLGAELLTEDAIFRGIARHLPLRLAPRAAE
ncbi:MAG TPA: PIN domain-containing protein [Anaeromyxobacter sp.]